MPGSRLDTPTKDRVIGAVEAGASYREAAKKFGTTRMKVWRAHKHWQQNGTTHYPPLPGRPRKLDDEAHRRLIQLARSDCRMPLAELGTNIEPNVSRSTVRKELAANLLHRRKARHKPTLKPWHKAARLFFARNALDLNPDTLHRVIWSDESYITIGDTPGVLYVTRKPGEEFDEKYIVPSDLQSNIRIMVWGCIMKDKKGPLVVLEYPGGKGGGMTAGRYKDQVLDPVLRPFYMEVSTQSDTSVFFQQDNASCHKAISTKQWLQQNNIQRFPHPSKSPDLTPIEPVWHDFKDIIRARHLQTPITSIEDLKAVAIDAWDCIPISKINAHIGRMRKAYEEVVRRNGSMTRY